MGDGRGMVETFFEHPILNSPYEYPGRHWELDADGQPTNVIAEFRRRSDLITPVPKPKKRRQGKNQAEMVFDHGAGLSTEEQEYNPTPIINEVRTHVEAWRKLPNPDQWMVTPETARLLKHWRHHAFQGVRPFFCQGEAVETAIWLTEVAPKIGPRGARFWTHLRGANEQANPELLRLALKLATGAGKTTVMAMLIAWQTVNAVRHPGSKHFSRGFLIVAPGITIRDRLRVLMPNDPDSYYRHREIVPPDMLGDIEALTAFPRRRPPRMHKRNRPRWKKIVTTSLFLCRSQFSVPYPFRGCDGSADGQIPETGETNPPSPAEQAAASHGCTVGLLLTREDLEQEVSVPVMGIPA